MKHAALYMVWVTLAGCGTAHQYEPRLASDAPVKIDNPTQGNADAAQTSVAQRKPSTVNGSSNKPKSETPIPPVPVTGAFVLAVAVDETGALLANAEVILEEDGLAPQKVTTNSLGQARVLVNVPSNVRRISVKRRDSLNISSIDLTASDRARLADSINDKTSDPNYVAPRLLQIKPVTNQNTLALTSIVNPANDQQPPVIAGLNTSPSGTGKLLRVSATDAESGLHSSAYSFDGGQTWSASAEKIFPSGTTLNPGTIQVRDKANNVIRWQNTLGL